MPRALLRRKRAIASRDCCSEIQPGAMALVDVLKRGPIGARIGPRQPLARPATPARCTEARAAYLSVRTLWHSCAQPPRHRLSRKSDWRPGCFDQELSIVLVPLHDHLQPRQPTATDLPFAKTNFPDRARHRVQRWTAEGPPSLGPGGASSGVRWHGERSHQTVPPMSLQLANLSRVLPRRACCPRRGMPSSWPCQVPGVQRLEQTCVERFVDRYAVFYWARWPARATPRNF